ncbi:MAG: 16S rRNA (cytosine(1402)-N(4))-methyltransferase RsmH [Planctomycetes bacterium]|nr:16S rRNA (cytosine(1402)-N(4))-methyltransferase RsmH [Planctomycetota bacterium]MCW8134836.1 16S rRNA (cytosine(1402)-N(4))-methyltransferase RsmH [Planctomycetota bacterium]
MRERAVAQHLPALVAAVADAFAGLEPGALVVDGTCGYGGHAGAILERNPGVRLVGMDRDPGAVEGAAEHLRRFGDRAVVVHGRFSRWRELTTALGMGPPQGLVLDLGVSSPQLDTPGRGFSFNSPGPIDMRMDPAEGASALDFLEGAAEDEIADVIWRLGEERFSRRIAKGIKSAIQQGRLSTTEDLAQICRRAYGKGSHRIDPATRTFQALRMHINDELGELERALAAVPEGLAQRGIVAVISFHSLEDRVVKHTYRDWQGQGLGQMLKPAPIIADEAERAANPRAKSAKLRLFARGKAAPTKEGMDQYRSKRHRGPRL